MCRAPSSSALATVCCWSSRDVLVRSKCIRFWPAFCSWVGRNRIWNPVSSVGRSARPSRDSSAVSQPRRPAQKRARRSGSFASKLSATRRQGIPVRISDLLTHSRRQGTSRPVCEGSDARALGDCGANGFAASRSEEHTSELQSRQYLVCRLLLEKKKTNILALPV